MTCIIGRRLKRRTWALNAEDLLEGEEFPVRNSMGDTPEVGPPVSARASIYSIFSHITLRCLPD